MANATRSQDRIDQFFSGPGARADRWRNILDIAQAWHAGKANRISFEAALAELATIEEFHAYPGPRLMAALRDRAATDDAAGAAALAWRIASALLTRSFRQHASDWDPHSDISSTRARRVASDAGGRRGAPAIFRGPYRHGGADRTMGVDRVGVAPAAPSARRVHVRTGHRRERRGCRLRGDVERRPRRRGNPRRFWISLAARCPGPPHRRCRCEGGNSRRILRLARAIHQSRPELDLYLLSNARVEEIAGDPAADIVRRVFYAVEELFELHLAILEGVAARYETPFFDNLKKYAQRPIGRFTPSRSPAASRFSSRTGSATWASFTARRSSWPRAAPRPAASTACSSRRATSSARRSSQLARSAPSAYFLLPTGLRQATRWCAGVAVARRHCNRRPQLPQVPPLRDGDGRRAAALRRSLPADRILDVRRGAATYDQTSAPGRKGRRAARPRQDGRSDQLHVRRPHLQHAPRHGRVSRDQTGPDLPLGRGLVRVRTLVAVPAPAYRDGRRQRYRGLAARPDEASTPTNDTAPSWGTIRRTTPCSTRGCCRILARYGCVSTRPTRRTSRCRRCGKDRWSW